MKEGGRKKPNCFIDLYALVDLHIRKVIKNVCADLVLGQLRLSLSGPTWLSLSQVFRISSVCMRHIVSELLVYPLSTLH